MDIKKSINNVYIQSLVFVVGSIVIIILYLRVDEAEFTGEFYCGRIASIVPTIIQSKYGHRIDNLVTIKFGENAFLSRKLKKSRPVHIGQIVKVLEKKTKITRFTIYTISYNGCSK